MAFLAAFYHRCRSEFILPLPASNSPVVSSFAKWVLIADMFIGRLEIYTLLILFVPAFWKK